jgi:RNA polymerase sigma-70 factor (ECF subfamily)
MAAIQDLPEVERAALLMRALDGMPYEEISQALSMSVNNVKVRVHRARLKLMEARRTLGNPRPAGEEK